MPTALITGTTGLVGSHVAAALAARYEIIELGRRPSRDGCAHLGWTLRGDLPSAMPAHIDLVVHAAATDGRNAVEADRECFEINVLATARLLQYAARAGAAQFVYFSTGSVLGLANLPSTETQAIAPEGHYAASKAAGEALQAGYAGQMRTLCLRLFFPYGAFPDGTAQRGSRLIPGLVERIRQGQPIPLHGDEGRPAINPVHISDVARWLQLLLERGAEGVFHLAGAQIVTIRQLAQQLASLLDLPASLEIGPSIGGNRTGAIEKVVAATGHTPHVSLAEGLARLHRPERTRAE